MSKIRSFLFNYISFHCIHLHFLTSEIIQKSRGTYYNGLYWQALPESGTFFRLNAYKGVGKMENCHLGIEKGLSTEHLEQNHGKEI